jgi:hypothetical protein
MVLRQFYDWLFLDLILVLDWLACGIRLMP